MNNYRIDDIDVDTTNLTYESDEITVNNNKLKVISDNRNEYSDDEVVDDYNYDELEDDYNYDELEDDYNYDELEDDYNYDELEDENVDKDEGEDENDLEDESDDEDDEDEVDDDEDKKANMKRMMHHMFYIQRVLSILVPQE
ncbi:23999_t:CDS:2 [Dentiscutata erythropus]|uniref:23999_t:CDS:1 n=1 Tax=Dentiscutata erythropus TaxID=1348616 RepID=A0A9N8VJK9_9GLOM|nr:23999_t:CDS:2 [Dentiscutata erythropus]